MTKGVSELVKEAESVADSALKGCPAETYALLTLRPSHALFREGHCHCPSNEQRLPCCFKFSC